MISVLTVIVGFLKPLAHGRRSRKQCLAPRALAPLGRCRHEQRVMQEEATAGTLESSGGHFGSDERGAGTEYLCV